MNDDAKVRSSSLHVIRCLINSYVFRGAPGGGAASFGGNAGTTKAIFANAI